MKSWGVGPNSKIPGGTVAYALPNVILISFVFSLGLALIAHTIFSQTNSHLFSLPIRARSTTNLDYNSRSYPLPAHNKTDLFFQREAINRNLNPLNRGQNKLRKNFII